MKPARLAECRDDARSFAARFTAITVDGAVWSISADGSYAALVTGGIAAGVETSWEALPDVVRATITDRLQ
jgi:hypothetical protein